MNARQKIMLVAGVVSLGVVSQTVWAITITSPVMPGDVFAVSVWGEALYQFRSNTTVSAISTTQLGGVTTDRNGNLWFAQGMGTTEAPLQIEMIPFAGTTSSVKLSGSALNAPTGATGIRDLIFDSGGNLYVSFFLSGKTLSLYKYAPDGLGGFQTGTSVGSFSGDFSDYGEGRLNLSPNELFVTVGAYPQDLYSMRLSDGTVTKVSTGTTSENVIGQALILPSYPNWLLYAARDGVRRTSFDPLTGAMGTSFPQLLTGNMSDGLAYSSAAGRLYLLNRANGGEIRFATNAQLAQAMSTPMAISSLGLLLQSSAASIDRDLAVVDPPAYPGVVQQGDIWVVDTALRSVHQFRGGSKVSTFTLNTDDMIGGVATDADANLYIAGTGLGVYRIPRGTNQVEWLLKPDEVAGSGLTVRDVAVASNGTLYVTYLGGSGRVDKFTPDGFGTYTRTPLGTTGLGSGDRGNHHSWLTNNGNYLLTSARGENKIVAMDTSTGSITSWTVPSGALVAEIALDPFTNEYVLFCGGDVGGAAPYQLYALSFNPTIGAFGTTPIPLNTDTDDWVDGLAFDPFTGDLYMSVRSNLLVKATYAQYLLALAGTPFDIDLLPRVYTGGEVDIARDMVVTNRVPEPTGCVLFVVGAAGLLLARRRFRNQRV